MSETENKPKNPFFSQASGVRLGAWGAVVCLAVLVPFSGQLAQRAQADHLSRPSLFQPQAEHLYLQAPSEVTEGQRFELHLGWRQLPAASQVEPVRLSLSWSDTSYTGQPLQPVQTLELGAATQTQSLLFESPGTRQLRITGPDGQWQELQFQVKPFAASVFPQNWESQRDLSPEPSRYQIHVNLHYDPKAPNQRQYAQIVYDGEILQRLLISSGAGAKVTPMGKFKLGFKDFYPRSSLYNNTPMPFWSAININGNQGEYGFHSLEDGGYIYLLGRPASHGCIRMSRQPSLETDSKTGEKFWGDRGGARWIYDRVPPETPVTIYKAPLPSFAFEDYEMYLARLAREYAARQSEKKS